MTLRRGWRVWRMAGLPVLLALLVLGLAVASQLATPQPAAAVAAQQDPAPEPTPIPPPPTEPPAEPTPPATPAPEPGPPPPEPDPDTSPSCTDGEDPALWDVGGQARQAITEFFCDFVEDTLNSVLETLGESVLATPDLTGNEAIRDVWTANLVIANAIYVLFIVAAGFVVASRETLQTSYGLKELIPRIVVAGLAANLSLLLVGQGIELANALTAGIAGQGVEPATAAEALTTIWENASVGTNFLMSLLLIAIIVMAIIVLVTFIIRVAVLAVLITIAPLALLFHALPQTEQVAFTWWKAVAGCFAIQLGQTVVLVAAVRVFLTPVGSTVLGFPSSGSGWLGILVALAMMWLLVKIPMWVKQYMWIQSRGVFRKVIFAFFMLKTLSMAAAGRGGGRGGRGGPRPNNSGGQPRPGPRRNPGPAPNPRNRPNPRPRPNPGPRPNPRPQPNPRNRPNPGPRPNPRPNPGPRPGPRPGPTPGPTPGPRPGPRSGSTPPPSPPPPNPGGGTTGAGPGTSGTGPGRSAPRPVTPADAARPGGGSPQVRRPAPAATGEPVRYSGAPAARRPALSVPPPRPGQAGTGAAAPRRPATGTPARPSTSTPPRSRPPSPSSPVWDTKTVPTGRAPATPPRNPPASTAKKPPPPAAPPPVRRSTPGGRSM